MRALATVGLLVSGLWFSAGAAPAPDLPGAYAEVVLRVDGMT